MDAPLLLAALRERGARVSVRLKETGEQVLVVAPRGIAGDLSSDVARFKPSLLELLQAERKAVSGAVPICATLQSFGLLFDLLHQGKIPASPCSAWIDGDQLVFEDVAATLRAMEKEWTERARSCNATKRELTGEEMAALERARQLLEHLSAAYSPDGWLDLESYVEQGIPEAGKRAKEYARSRAAVVAEI